MGARYHFITYRDGEESYDAVGTPVYAAGQPAAVVAGGGVGFSVGGLDDKFIGILTNPSPVDSANGNVSIWEGFVKCDLFDNTSGPQNIAQSGTTTSGVDGDGAPFDITKSYARGDLLFINPLGFWTNEAPGGSGNPPSSGSVVHGIVLVAPATATDTMVALFFGIPSSA